MDTEGLNYPFGQRSTRIKCTVRHESNMHLSVSASVHPSIRLPEDSKSLKVPQSASKCLKEPEMAIEASESLTQLQGAFEGLREPQKV